MVDGNRGIRAEHEDTHSLRLTSKLVDLRSGYANPVHCGYAASTVVREPIPLPERKKAPLLVGAN